MDFASLEPLEGGWSGETFLARVASGEPAVVRIHARDPGRAEVDAALLRLVRDLLPVPEVLEVRRASGGMPALLVTSYLPGERGDLVLPRLGAEQQAVLGACVGELVATLGGMPLPRAGELAEVVDGDLRIRPWDLGGLVDHVDAALDAGLQHWTGGERDGLREVADRAEQLLDTVTRHCLVHSDVNPKNLLVDPETLAVTGLVDWEYAHAGHPFTDLGNVLRFDRAPAYVDAVLAAYERARHVPPAEALELARAADLVALVELAGRAGQNPVADAAEQLLRAVARTGDPHATPG
jgi:aminoglycoside phosphotransferase (APT) family kinase protein